MSYEDLRWLGVTFRPIDKWEGVFTDHRRYSNFSAPLTQTISLLARELRALNAQRIVLQLAIEEGDLRRDGLPRSQAKAKHPGVILAFDSRFGPLKYATDEFTTWQDNLRGIAKSMEALRLVDRYGVSKRGEQYTGWRALPASGGFDSSMDARAFLAEHGGYTQAVKAFHPDNPETGDREMFDKVQAARELVGA